MCSASATVIAEVATVPGASSTTAQGLQSARLSRLPSRSGHTRGTGSRAARQNSDMSHAARAASRSADAGYSLTYNRCPLEVTTRQLTVSVPIGTCSTDSASMPYRSASTSAVISPSQFISSMTVTASWTGSA